MVFHGLKSSGRATGDMVVVHLSRLIGVTREDEGKKSQQHGSGMKVPTGEVSPLLE